MYVQPSAVGWYAFKGSPGIVAMKQKERSCPKIRPMFMHWPLFQSKKYKVDET